MDKIGIIILHYSDIVLTLNCLVSLFASELKNKELCTVLVLNSNEDNFAQKIKDKYPKVLIIENHENLGYSGANNKGINKAIELGCGKFILINNDTVVDKKLVNSLVDFANNDKNIGLVSPKIYFAPDHEYHLKRYKIKDRGNVLWYAGGKLDADNVYASHYGLDEVDNGQFNSIRETDFTTGCCMLITRDVIDRVGLLDEKYFMYFEDIDYSIRAKRAGLQVMYYPFAFLWHKNASTSGSPGSLTHIYYQTRNRLYFGFKYFSWRVKKSLILDSLKLGFRGGAYLKGVIDYYIGRMGKK